MRKLILILTLALTSTLSTRACLNTSQFKIFPIGIYNGTIYTIDVLIKRTSQGEGCSTYKLNSSGTNPTKEMYILQFFESSYTKTQVPIKSTPLDTVYVFGNSYLDSLKTTYLRSFNLTLIKNQKLELFSPNYISFCELNKNCEMTSLGYDSTSKTDYVSFDHKTFKIPTIHLIEEVGFGFNPFYAEDLKHHLINSIRVYTIGDTKLCIAHFSANHEKNNLSSKEFVPNTIFKDIKTAVYTEPLVHHSTGFDLFFIKE